MTTIYPSWVFDSVLTSDECEKYRDLIDTYKCPTVQTIQSKREIADVLWAKLKDKLPHQQGYTLIGLSDYISLSKHEHGVGIHKDVSLTDYYGKIDPSIVCLYKISIYLNQVSGTIFYNDLKESIYTFQPQMGRAIIFDMREWHSGEKIPNGQVKYLIGARALYQKNQ